MNRLMLDYNVLYIVLVAAGLVFFGAVFLSTRPAQRAKPVKIDAWMGREVVWLVIVIVILLGSVAATIGHTPWSASAESGRQIVRVAAVQYGFRFSTTTMHVGRQVEFRLTAADVNHGFAVFDPSGTLRRSPTTPSGSSATSTTWRSSTSGSSSSRARTPSSPSSPAGTGTAPGSPTGTSC